MFIEGFFDSQYIRNSIPKSVFTLMSFFKENNFDIFLIGGISRNFFTNETNFVQDIDLSTSAEPLKIIELINESDILNKFKLVRVMDNGYKYGTIKIVCKKYSIDITSFRKDVACYGRQGDVVFTDSQKEDSVRRDFSMNAIYVDIKGNVYDYHNGIVDIKKQQIVFIEEPETRIKEDFLRILRLFRFNAKLKFSIPNEYLDLCKKYKNQLSRLSNERVISELTKIVALPYSSSSLEMISNCGISDLFFNKKYLINLDNDYIDKIKEKAKENVDQLILSSFLIKNDISIYESKVKFSNYIKKIYKIYNLCKKNGFDIFTSKSNEMNNFIIKEYLNNNKDIVNIKYLNSYIENEFWILIENDFYKLPYSINQIIENYDLQKKEEIGVIKNLYINYLIQEGFRKNIKIYEIYNFIDKYYYKL